MNLEQILIKKANAYHGVDGRFTTINNAVITTKPKDSHSEKAKSVFSKQRKELADYKRNAKKDLTTQTVPKTDIEKKQYNQYANAMNSLLRLEDKYNKALDNKQLTDKQRASLYKKLYGKGGVASKLSAQRRTNENWRNYYEFDPNGKPEEQANRINRMNDDNKKQLTKLLKTYGKGMGGVMRDVMASTQKSELLSTLATIYRVKKANPYKDETGKWTSKDKAKTIAEWFYEGGKEQIKRTSAGLAGAAVGGLAGAGAGSLVGSGLAAAGSSYLTGAASGLTSIPLLGESLSGLAKASAPTAAGIATGAALGSMAGLGVLGIGAGAYLGAKTAGAAVGGYLGAKGGYEVGTALYDSNLSEKIEEWKSNAKDKASAQTDKLKDTVKARVGDLKNKASKEFDAAKQKTHAAIESKAAQAKELIKQKANEAKNKAKAAATSKLKELTTRYKPIKKYDLTALRNA